MSKSLEVVNFHGIITASPKMKVLFETLQRVARTESSILLRGDSGTGKELFAQAIHTLSPRKAKPYRALNCATLSEQLMSSELFGHVKGAFTGASHQHDGLFHTVHEGSIFLDEIAEIPLVLQAKLLRVFQEKAFNRVGSTKVEHVDVRFISATHKSLRNMVAQGSFREDLMYRLRVVPLFLPRLRERNEDIQVLTERFIDEFNQRGHRTIEHLSKEALDAMLSYPWPGNIRELRNNIEYAFAIGMGNTLKLEDLTPELQGKQPPEEKALESLEKEQLIQSLRDNNGHKGKAAQQLGMSRPTFWRKCKLYNIY